MKKWLSLWLIIALLVPSMAFATQAPIVVPDGTGASVRAGFNNALVAINTNFEGATVPNPTYAGMFWADTGSGTLWQRNQANTAWVQVGILDSQYLGLIPATAASTTPSAGIIPKANSLGLLPFSITGNAATATAAATASNSNLLQGYTAAQVAAMGTSIVSSGWGGSGGYYRKWSDGMIEQFGNAGTVNAGMSASITFATPFPSAVIYVNAIAVSNARGSTNSGVQSYSNGGFTAWNGDATGPMLWYAVGY